MYIPKTANTIYNAQSLSFAGTAKRKSAVTSRPRAARAVASNTRKAVKVKRYKINFKRLFAAIGIGLVLIKSHSPSKADEIINGFKAWISGPQKQVMEQIDSNKFDGADIKFIAEDIISKDKSNIEKNSNDLLLWAEKSQSNKMASRGSISRSVNYSKETLLEIENLKNQPYQVKDDRLKKLYKTNEPNPELKDYLLSCRMDFINKNMDPEWAKLVNTFCKKYGLNTEKDKLTVISQMLQESQFDPNALSPAGAYGLMQVTPDTASLFNNAYVNGSDPLISFDKPKNYKKLSDNIEVGITIFSDNLRLYNKCEDKYKTALASYNAGTASVDAYLKGITIKIGKRVINPRKIKTPHGIPPYKETEMYVKIVEDTRNYMEQHLDKLEPSIKTNLDITS